MFLMYLMTALQWLYPVFILLALLASLRYARLSKSSPLLSGGIGLIFVVNLLSKLFPLLLPHLPRINSEVPNAFYTSPFFLISSALTLASLFGWALMAYGLYSVLEEVSQKLAFVQLASENSWNYNAAPIQQHGQALQSQQVQSPFIQTQPQQIPLSRQDQEQSREEVHASAFVSPIASAPSVEDSRPVVSVQPANNVTLGSGRQ